MFAPTESQADNVSTFTGPWWMVFLRNYIPVMSIQFFIVWLMIIFDFVFTSHKWKFVPKHRYATFIALTICLPLCAGLNYKGDLLSEEEEFEDACDRNGWAINYSRGTVFRFTAAQVVTTYFASPPVRQCKQSSFGNWKSVTLCCIWIALLTPAWTAWLIEWASQCKFKKAEWVFSWLAAFSCLFVYITLSAWRLYSLYSYWPDTDKFACYWFQGEIPDQHPGKIGNVNDEENMEMSTSKREASPTE